uniref:formate dehydrogenase (coenzyme F420) n=1 Tax=Candidatus Methanophaga sp. ANME-1 ERB7 TaxID=2759913 RepID=A0A7G9Z593_9EURY|nr:formate dehydrogenase subunit beta [Methanosarcinales archaeon ANME-1 ERB7]
MKGDMYLASASDEEILKRGEYGGAVTALLKFALDSGVVDAVLGVKKRDNNNRYDGVLDLITDPGEVIDCAGSLHCVSLNIARNVKEYLDGAKQMKIAVPCKPCDARAIIEIAKRKQIDKDDLLLVGLNCTGTLPPVVAKEMLISEYEVDPNEVVMEDIEGGELIITLADGTKIAKDLLELEKKGYGRRDNCRRCNVNIPTMADIACGKWGVKEGEKKTFTEVCSDKGAELIDNAIKAGVIKVDPPGEDAIEERKRKDREAIELSNKCEAEDLKELREISLDDRLAYWLHQFDRCIKCFSCRDACPICYCKKCSLEPDRGYVKGGEVPPDRMFHLTRLTHDGDSCVNCGQCQDACPAEIPLTRLYLMLNNKLSPMFDYVSGMDVEQKPPLIAAKDEEASIDDIDIFLAKGEASEVVPQQ